MDEEIERLVVSVRADTAGFAGDVATMRSTFEDGLGGAASRTGDLIENALLRGIRSGKLGFDDLRRVALSAMNDIAASALRAGVGSLGGGGGGLLSLATTALGSLLGLLGRATGGPVAPGRGYVVGERGPELFVPTASGQIVMPGGGGRDVRVSVTINAPAGEGGAMLARSSRQVARAVRSVIEAAGD
ncbi:MAG: tail tape measure protein [Sphingomonadaceae bacterium]